MKRNPVLFLGCFFLCLFAVTALGRYETDASAAMKDFQYQAEIKGPIQKGYIYQVVLPGRALAKMSPRLGDLRVYGPHQTEIPYVIIDNVTPEVPGRYVTLEAVRYEPADEWTTIYLSNPEPAREIHALAFGIPDQDFQKEVILEGSFDQANWNRITRDTIYDFTTQIDLRKVRLNFANTRCKFFRVKMRDVRKPKNPEQTIRVQLKGADVSIDYPDAKKIQIQRIEALTGNSRESVVVYDHQAIKPLKPIAVKNHKTIIDIQSGLRFERIDFEIGNPLYYRQVHIYYSETGAEDSYQLLAGEDIYRTSTQTHNFLLNHFPHYPYYRFEIENKDDLPLEIKEIRLTWIQKILCFNGLESAPAYTLCYGNSRVEAPDYDLKKLIRQDNWVQVFDKQGGSNRLSLDKTITNPSFRSNFGGKQGNQEGFVLTIVVILLVAGLGVWLYKLFRRATP
jgi:hypothetical protein